MEWQLADVLILARGDALPIARTREWVLANRGELQLMPARPLVRERHSGDVLRFDVAQPRHPRGRGVNAVRGELASEEWDGDLPGLLSLEDSVVNLRRNRPNFPRLDVAVLVPEDLGNDATARGRWPQPPLALPPRNLFRPAQGDALQIPPMTWVSLQAWPGVPFVLPPPVPQWQDVRDTRQPGWYVLVERATDRRMVWSHPPWSLLAHRTRCRCTSL